MLVGSAAQAADAPQPASSAPSSILGVNLAGGFTAQPQDTRAVSAETVTLSAKAQRSALEAATSLIGSRKYVWWESTDGGTTYTKVGTNSSTYTFTAPTVTQSTALKFQVQYDYSGLGTYADYWSRISTVTVEPNRIPTTGISVSVADSVLYNQQVTLAMANLTPSNATDDVKWTSSDPSLATVDQYGVVTATAASTDTSGTAHDHGKVTITATSNGYSASTDIVVGSIQDVQVVEGTPATFTLEGLPAGVQVTNWYRVKDGQATALNVTANSYTVPKPTYADDDGTSYYATVSYTLNGETKTVTSNAARLTVTPGGSLNLTAVPNFNFGRVSVAELSRGVDLKTTAEAASGDAYDGNNTHTLSVSDQRTVGNDWQLTVSLAPLSTTGGPAIGNAQLELADSTGQIKQTVNANRAAVGIQTQAGQQSRQFDLTPTTLHLDANPLASVGTYHSTLTWTLALVPAS